MPLPILLLLLAAVFAAALCGLVALVNRERAVYAFGRSYRPPTGQPEDTGEQVGSAYGSKGWARRSMTLP